MAAADAALLEAARAEGAARPEARAAALAPGRLVTYALPVLPIAFMWNMLGFYFLKFSTDVLLLAPGAMGLAFGLSRIWDAFSDPLAGYWSDRTRTRLGRRRPWILLSALQHLCDGG